jgi:NTP pyrophosphatase (non-canonical NTP hydrolase)
MSVLNPNCDGGDCTGPTQVRRYFLGGHSNLNLCQPCWHAEDEYAISRGWPRTQWSKAPVVWSPESGETKPVRKTEVYAEIHAERERAHTKHGARGNSREDAAWSEREWLPILMEELGEVAHEMTYDVETLGRAQRMRAELVQVAAMAAAWIDAIDRSGSLEPHDRTAERGNADHRAVSN